LILDIDLHFGDGTSNIFRGRDDVTYLHPEGSTREEWLDDCREGLDEAPAFDIVAISAGFDRHVDDWGQLLTTDDYHTTGRWVRELADARCQGRRFALLEGGYNSASLADAAVALARGHEIHDLVDTAKVTMAEFGERVLRWYVATGEPLDKAGGYGIQGKAGVLVTGVEGSPHTVVGLPIHRLPELFSRHRLDLWSALAP
jgi:hypothetical protein